MSEPQIESSKSKATVASWICLLSALLLPGCYRLVTSVWHNHGYYPLVNYTLYGFLLAQTIAVFLGVRSLFEIPKGHASGIIARSILGILGGCIGGFWMVVLAALAE
jgi:hypothetical protein